MPPEEKKTKNPKLKETKETKEEKPTKKSGGFKIKEEHKEPQNEQEGLEPSAEELDGEDLGAAPSSEAQLQVAKAMVETACMVTGNIAKLVTKIDEMAFDEEETNQLVELWSPLMPQLTPVVAAIIGTSIIIGGKVGVYYSKKKESKGGEEAATK